MSSTTTYQEITPTYLYIKQHSVTGLKYFGKTTQADPYKYLGSGTRWVNNYKKHGKEHIKTLWVSDLYYDTSIIEIALHFSVENDIVESDDWDNIISENGLDGGGNGKKGKDHPNFNKKMSQKFKDDCSIRTTKKNIESNKNRTHQWNSENRSEEHRAKLAIAKIGNQNRKGIPHTPEGKLGCAKGGMAQKGRPKPEGLIENLAIKRRESILINNDTKSIFIKNGEIIPEGWQLGYPDGIHSGENNPRFGTIVINNGFINKTVPKNDIIDDGWDKGYLKYFCIISTRKAYSKRSKIYFPDLNI